MGHIESERCPFFKGIRVGNPKQKMAKKNSWSKAAKPSFSSHLFCSIITRERVGETRDERLREGYARADTHTHTHRERKRESGERRCVIVRFVRVTREREREIDAFFFLRCDGRTYPNEREAL